MQMDLHLEKINEQQAKIHENKFVALFLLVVVLNRKN